MNVVGRKGAALLGPVRGRAGPLENPDLLQHCEDGPLILQSTTTLTGHVQLHRVEPQQKVLGGKTSYLRCRCVMPLHACIFRSTVKMELSPCTARMQNYPRPLTMQLRSPCQYLLILGIGSSADPLGHSHLQQSFDNTRTGPALGQL